MFLQERLWSNGVNGILFLLVRNPNLSFLKSKITSTGEISNPGHAVVIFTFVDATQMRFGVCQTNYEIFVVFLAKGK